MVTKFGGQILATKFGFVPDWLAQVMAYDGSQPLHEPIFIYH